MKAKFLAVITAFVLITCGAFCVACKPDEPPTPPSPDPVYVTMSLEDYLTKAEGFYDIANYMSVAGYRFELTTHTEEGMASMDNELNALLDLSQLDDVKVSASLQSTTLYPPESEPEQPEQPEQESSGVGEIRSMQPEKMVIETNLYLYNQTLYVDATVDGQTEKDSLTGVNNDLTSLLAELIASPAQEQEEQAPSNEVTEELAGLMVYLADYLTIKYCEELGHYVFDLDYTEGGVYEGTQIDPFELNAEMYVKNGRVTQTDFEFLSDQYRASGCLAEYSGSINYPEQPESYQGDLIESFMALIELFGEVA